MIDPFSVTCTFRLTCFHLQYVMTACQTIKKTAHWEVDVEVDLFHAKSGANRLVSGLFTGKTLVYSDLNHVVVRILPKYVSEAREHSILVSSHIDTVFSTYVFFIYLLPYFCFKQYDIICYVLVKVKSLFTSVCTICN